MDGELTRWRGDKRSIDPLIRRSIFACLLLSSACATRVFVPPAAPVTPDPNAAAIWSEVTTRCRDTQRYVAGMRVNGWAGANRERLAPPTMHGAVTRTDDIYLEIPVPGGPVLQMAGRGGEVTVLLPRDRRAMRGATREIVAALTGLDWGPRELLDVLTGCVAPTAGNVSGGRTGRLLHVRLSPSADAWLRESSGRWQLHAARVDGWLLEYRRHDVFWPAEIRVTASSPTPLDLTFTLTTQQANIDVPDTAFALAVPGDYTPLTLEELRAAGPLRQMRK